MKPLTIGKRIALPLALLGTVLSVGLTGCNSNSAGPDNPKTTQTPELQIRPNTFTLANGQRVTMTATQTGNRLVGKLTVLDATATSPTAPAPTQPAPTQEPTQAPTQVPTQMPTQAPTQAPNQEPIEEPTQAPNQEPIKEPTPNFSFPFPSPSPTAAFQRSQAGLKLGTQKETFAFQIAVGTYPFTGIFASPRNFDVIGNFGSQGAFNMTGEFATESGDGLFNLTVNNVTDRGILPRLAPEPA